MNTVILDKKENDLFLGDGFIYRVNPHDYIQLTKELVNSRMLFNKIASILKHGGSGQTLNAIQKDLLLQYSSLLKRFGKNDSSQHSDDYFIEILKDFETYRYFYKEVGASLKFNPLSGSDAGKHVLEKLLFLLDTFITLITPKVLFKYIETIPGAEGLGVAGTSIYFNNKKLRIFSSHSSFNQSKEINPWEMLSKSVIVYIVTIGPGIDNEVKTMMEKGEMFDAYLLNGIGAGAAEMVANDLNRYMNDENTDKDYEYKRLSPGYGDWNVSDQTKIFSLLTPEKYIGVKLTDSHIMLPEKSTSGIMGLRLKENKE